MAIYATRGMQYRQVEHDHVEPAHEALADLVKTLEENPYQDAERTTERQRTLTGPAKELLQAIEDLNQSERREIRDAAMASFERFYRQIDDNMPADGVESFPDFYARYNALMNVQSYAQSVGRVIMDPPYHVGPDYPASRLAIGYSSADHAANNGMVNYAAEHNITSDQQLVQHLLRVNDHNRWNDDPKTAQGMTTLYSLHQMQGTIESVAALRDPAWQETTAHAMEIAAAYAALKFTENLYQKRHALRSIQDANDGPLTTEQREAADAIFPTDSSAAQRLAEGLQMMANLPKTGAGSRDYPSLRKYDLDTIQGAESYAADVQSHIRRAKLEPQLRELLDAHAEALKRMQRTGAMSWQPKAMLNEYNTQQVAQNIDRILSRT